MEVQIHTKRGFRMRYKDQSHFGYVDLTWDANKDDEVTFFIPPERKERYRRAVEAFQAVLTDESIKDDVLAEPEERADHDMVDF